MSSSWPISDTTAGERRGRYWGNSGRRANLLLSTTAIRKISGARRRLGAYVLQNPTPRPRPRPIFSTVNKQPTLLPKLLPSAMVRAGKETDGERSGGQDVLINREVPRHSVSRQDSPVRIWRPCSQPVELHSYGPDEMPVGGGQSKSPARESRPPPIAVIVAPMQTRRTLLLVAAGAAIASRAYGR